jgi:hypothetical protein
MTDKTEKVVQELLSDPIKFREFVYTPLESAIKELRNRTQSSDITTHESLRTHFNGELRAVLFRHIATPNYEIRRFLSLMDGLEGLRPLILEYTEDKFTNANEWKHSLGKIPFFKGFDSKDNMKFEAVSVIDFNQSNGKPISEVKTLWGQSLVSFHHELFARIYPNLDENIKDLSEWIHKNGQSAKNYYKQFLKIFIRQGVLFDSFLTEGEEQEFTKNIILPCLIEIEEETGYKPLIVSLEPTETEKSKFWLCHPYEDKSFVVQKIKG